MKDYDKMNDRYMKMMKGDKQKIMKHHGNVSPIDANSQKFDMKRMDFLKKEKRGYDDKAWEYKY